MQASQCDIVSDEGDHVVPPHVGQVETGEGVVQFLESQVEHPPLPRGRRSTGPATAGEMENTFAALRYGLERIDFFKVRTPEAVMRTLRTVLVRAEPDLQEAGILRAIGFEIGHYLDRLERSEPPPPEGIAPSGEE